MVESGGITIDPTDYPFPTRHEVIAAIREAFSGVDREGAVSLHQADVIDGYGIAQEQAVARLLDTDQIWEQVPIEDMRQCSSALSFLDPKGFRYYIAAFTVRGLELDYLDDFTRSALFHVARLDRNDPYHEERLELLDDKQRRAISLFLLYFSTEPYSDDNVRDALHRFWNDYLPAKYRPQTNDA